MMSSGDSYHSSRLMLASAAGLGVMACFMPLTTWHDGFGGTMGQTDHTVTSRGDWLVLLSFLPGIVIALFVGAKSAPVAREAALAAVVPPLYALFYGLSFWKPFSGLPYPGGIGATCLVIAAVALAGIASGQVLKH